MTRSIGFTIWALACAPLYGQVQQKDIEDFARHFAYSNRIHIDEVSSILDQAEFQPEIIKRMEKPAESMPWYRYRNIFMTEERIAAGVDFWNEHDAVLKDVSAQYKVDPEVILGIIGVESFYGRRKGNYRVLDALYTLTFGYPKRSRFFKSELEDYILLALDEGLDIFELKGSYAGAIGYSQFMPSSYLAYARSYEENGQRDLVGSPEDAIASVANYLAEHRWHLSEAVALEAKATSSAQPLTKETAKPKHDLAHYEKLGYAPCDEIDANLPVSLLTFEAEEGNEHWFTHHNFYVITRYNHSSLYALAVFQLAKAIKERRQSNY